LQRDEACRSDAAYATSCGSIGAPVGELGDAAGQAELANEVADGVCVERLLEDAVRSRARERGPPRAARGDAHRRERVPLRLVAETRVYDPIEEIAPATADDSGAPDMQHMAVVRDFAIGDDETSR